METISKKNVGKYTSIKGEREPHSESTQFLYLKGTCKKNINRQVIFRSFFLFTFVFLSFLLSGCQRGTIYSKEQFFEAIKNNKYLELKKIVDSGIDINLVNSARHNGLFVAISKGNIESAKVLIEGGIDINYAIVNYSEEQSSGLYSSRKAAIHHAVSLNKIELVELLLDNGADINSDGMANATPLGVAIVNRHHKIMELLISRGADVNFADSELKVTPLIIAAIWGNIEAAKVLLENGAKVDVYDVRGWSPINLVEGYDDIRLRSAFLKLLKGEH